MPASAPGRGALELRGVTKRYGTGQGGQVTAAEACHRSRSRRARSPR